MSNQDRQDAEIARKKEIADRRAFLLARPELKFTYVRETDMHGDEAQFGGLVLCWMMPQTSDGHAKNLSTLRMLNVSTAWCHDNERFNKVDGRYYAAMNYLSGQKVLIKLPQISMPISAKLQDLFRHML